MAKRLYRRILYRPSHGIHYVNKKVYICTKVYLKNSDKYIISWLAIKSPNNKKKGVSMKDWNEQIINYHGQGICAEEAFLVWCDLGNDPAQFNELIAIEMYDQYFEYK